MVVGVADCGVECTPVAVGAAQKNRPVRPGLGREEEEFSFNL
jgi:hypothetical protein